MDQIYHLASPASPPHYMYNPIKTIKTNSIGTLNMLGLARRVKARLLLASTSEVYGDPEEHPQEGDLLGSCESDRTASVLRRGQTSRRDIVLCVC